MPPAPGDVEARDVWAAHGAVPALRGVTVVVPAGAVVAVVGPNGAGKTTLLRVLAGLHPPQRGRVLLDGEDLTGVRAHRLARRGVVLVPEGSGIFPGLTVGENLRMGRDGASEEALRRFPVLRERIRQRAGTLSGGEQQMLALARCVSSEAGVVMLDEPSLGLAPRLVDAAFDAVATIRRSGRTVVLVEQHVRRALEVADLVYVLRKGERVFAGEPGELEGSATLEGVYLGRAGAARRGRGR